MAGLFASISAVTQGGRSSCSSPRIPDQRAWPIADWAGSVRLAFTPLKESVADASSLKEIYNKEVYIYEVPRVLPRASLFKSVESPAGQRRAAPAQGPKLQSGEHSSLVSRGSVRRRIGRAECRSPMPSNASSGRSPYPGLPLSAGEDRGRDKRARRANAQRRELPWLACLC